MPCPGTAAHRWAETCVNKRTTPHTPSPSHIRQLVRRAVAGGCDGAPRPQAQADRQARAVGPAAACCDTARRWHDGVAGETRGAGRTRPCRRPAGRRPARHRLHRRHHRRTTDGRRLALRTGAMAHIWPTIRGGTQLPALPRGPATGRAGPRRLRVPAMPTRPGLPPCTIAAGWRAPRFGVRRSNTACPPGTCAIATALCGQTTRAGSRHRRTGTPHERRRRSPTVPRHRETPRHREATERPQRGLTFGTRYDNTNCQQFNVD